MSEYVPSVDDLTRALSYWGRMTRDEARSALAAHDREVEAKALRVAAAEFDAVAYRMPATWLAVRADRIESPEDENDE